MKRITTLLALILLIASAPAAGSNYDIPEVSVNIQIHENGTATISEHLTYRFDGSFSWAEANIAKEGFSEIRNIRVSEGNWSYLNENTEEPGTFSVSDRNNSVDIRWHYSAQDTSRTFTITYELTDVLTIGPDHSQFYWHFLGSGRDKATENFTATIQLPGSPDNSEIHTWGRVSEDRFSISIDDGTVLAEGNQLSRNETAAVRILFPTAVLDTESVSVTDSDFTLAGVAAEEEDRIRQAAERAERDAFYASITLEVTIIISLLSIFIFVLLYKKYSTRFKTKTISDRESLIIPDQTPPALSGKLINHHMITGHHFVSTVFDLARRGWFVIEEQKPEDKRENGWFSFEDNSKSKFIISDSDETPSDDLNLYEKETVRFVKKQISEGVSEFSKLLSEGGYKTSQWFSGWQKSVKKEFDKLKWVDKESYKAVGFNVAGQLVLIGASIYILVMGTEIAMIALGITFLMCVFSFAMVRRTESGEKAYRRWKAYAKGLKNADKRTVRMEMMDRHFIYATAFQLSEKEIETLIGSTDQSASFIFPWIILTQGSIHTPASVASSVSTLAASGTNSFSGISGGGGAVAGSAGGGTSASAG
ncbi:DUF2207 domain-containing protein [Rhodohalobacter sp. SW132]|uniref:DUF2207 domain-containing protein n=1 Tax=Rhodohalobacter sp. SW132 TaxID=2293433 RepID=UPI000E2431FA|nr:DUF2207 domain-containing protein [Rhodohalobacter sp. SW132]REL24321.1 DUF2207 domain-containing protein [Rhodohalobacter sp. SW132]